MMHKQQKSLILLALTLLVTGIMLGAFGAHSLEGKISEKEIDTFEVGVRYQIYHGFGFFCLAFLFPYIGFSLKWIKSLLLIGIILFSGSIYMLALNKLTGLNWNMVFGPLTPLGGSLLIVSWLLLIFQVFRQKV